MFLQTNGEHWNKKYDVIKNIGPQFRDGALFIQKVKFPSHVKAVFAIVIVAILIAS
jgi:hypothetical protein